MTDPPNSGRPLVFATVGTDHHRFDRLVGWMDDWLAAGGAQRADCLIQIGTSRPPRNAEYSTYMPFDEVRRAMADATVVVSHGGPATILLAHAAGKLPIVLPRTRAEGEHVDDHQTAFAQRAGRAGLIVMVETEQEFRRALDDMLTGSNEPTTQMVQSFYHDAVDRFEGVVAEMFGPTTNGERDEADVKVVYIGGCGRSGSTLLSTVLGAVPGVVAVGELRHLWRAIERDELCGCGMPVSRCPFWEEVGAAAFGGWRALGVGRQLQLERLVDRHRRIPALVWPATQPAYRAALREYATTLSHLYRGISSVSGAATVLDSTKDPSYGFILRHVDGISLRMVHLVRDSRGVAYSWQKRTVKPEVTSNVEYMDRYSPGRMALRWSAYNTLLHGLRALGVPTMFVRYEQFAADPTTVAQRVLAFAGSAQSEGNPPSVPADMADLPLQHTIAGNPMRFRLNGDGIAPDEQWRSEMPRGSARRVAALSAPLLAAYGYVGPRRAAQREDAKRSATGGEKAGKVPL